MSDSDAKALPVTEDLHRVERLAWVSVWIDLGLGATALWSGVNSGVAAFWGFGAACLLLAPPAVSVYKRVRDGLGNRGLDRERVSLRITSHLLRMLALVMASASVIELNGNPVLHFAPESMGIPALALGCFGSLWLAKRRLARGHPTLAFDATRTRTGVELATLLFVGHLLGCWFCWADAITGCAMALRLFMEGRTWAKGTALPPACGGCGGGCGCG